ncbi:MAG: hypothetical protein IJ272_01580 [Clostridia bacterium]|nr:hypothetical protein [Clostridia bacterium]
MKKIENILWGILFIVIGIIVLLNSLGITNINIFFKGWWTLFIIIPSVIGLIKGEERTWNIFFLALGVALLLSARGLLDLAIIAKCIIPAILIIIGVNIIFKDKINAKVDEKVKELNKVDTDEYYATFSGQKLNFNFQEFKGAKLNAIFGGIDLDLRKAEIKEDVAIDVCAVFGGVDIKVPQGVSVKVQSNSIFGGVSNKGHTKDGKPTIYIKAMCMFGGCDINE